MRGSAHLINYISMPALRLLTHSRKSLGCAVYVVNWLKGNVCQCTDVYDSFLKSFVIFPPTGHCFNIVFNRQETNLLPHLHRTLQWACQIWPSFYKEERIPPPVNLWPLALLVACSCACLSDMETAANLFGLFLHSSTCSCVGFFLFLMIRFFCLVCYLLMQATHDERQKEQYMLMKRGRKEKKQGEDTSVAECLKAKSLPSSLPGPSSRTLSWSDSMPTAWHWERIFAASSSASSMVESTQSTPSTPSTTSAASPGW